MISEDIKKAYKLAREHPELFQVKFFVLLSNNFGSPVQRCELKSQVITICMN